MTQHREKLGGRKIQQREPKTHKCNIVIESLQIEYDIILHHCLLLPSFPYPISHPAHPPLLPPFLRPQSLPNDR